MNNTDNNDYILKQSDNAEDYIRQAIQAINNANDTGHLPTGCYAICTTRLEAALQSIDMIKQYISR